MSDGEEDYFIPLQDQRVFGAGIKRKGIAFVAASNEETSPPRTDAANASNVGDRYLSIVLSKTTSTADRHLQPPSKSPPPGLALEDTPPQPTQPLCTICNQPISTTTAANQSNRSGTHESSIAHQLCLTHSHPPSHLPRDHIGLKYLSTYGWDPDSRTGLGPKQEGIRAPIKAREKRDTAGLRERANDDNDDDDGINLTNQQRRRNKDKLQMDDKGPVLRLNAKQVRRKEAEAKKRAEKLRTSFYGQDLEAYLGPGG